MIENTRKRIDIVLPEVTLELIDRVWPQQGFSSRSSFLNEAARRYAIRLKKASLKRRPKAGYLVRAKRDSGNMQEWESASSEIL